MYYLAISVTLYLFWLLLSGHYTALLLTLGGISVLLVVWFLRRMDLVDGEPSFVPPAPSLIPYGFWLLWSVVKSNVEVAYRIWHPSLPIKPAWRRLPTRVSTRLETTLYANSITLTPGTLTTDVRKGHFIVHHLYWDEKNELEEGEMENRIKRLGI